MPMLSLIMELSWVRLIVFIYLFFNLCSFSLESFLDFYFVAHLILSSMWPALFPMLSNVLFIAFIQFFCSRISFLFFFPVKYFCSLILLLSLLNCLSDFFSISSSFFMTAILNSLSFGFCRIVLFFHDTVLLLFTVLDGLFPCQSI